MQQRHRDQTGVGRRQFLGTTAASVGTLAIAGCLGGFGSGEDPFDDYGPQAAPVESSAVSWDDLGDLEGELTIYSARTADQINPLFEEIEAEYDDFEIRPDYDDEGDQLASLLEEGENSPADLFYTQSSGELARLKDEALARELPEDVIDAVDDNYSDSDGHWTGTSGRVRAIQYNTDEFSAEELPDDIFEYATDDRFQDVISTRPNSGTFRSFIVAMIDEEGEDTTREWVSNMVNEQNATLYSSGSAQAEAVANGEQEIALGNQYYAGRIVGNDPDAPLDVAFTNNDPGCLFNVSGIAILEGADKPNLAAEFTRHVLARQGQEFFVDTNGEYPVVDGVDYVGSLPALDEINPLEFDLNKLSNVEHAQDLLREEGMTV
ncbi:extracellular solute-binding protein [Natronorubrum sulfidifaciens]|uniref:Iron(III) ABC transporter periplasmic substrate-binding protein n=1 Tax=Natronorubrum sulfidifaciens JCM 14089 TaxID=1230460 RepID=L9WCM4_9EURY|nr:extracellular solute-binding protein [Natronorubrum sulfidifaciens]ELY46058.1 iron(III) ABC transporter periplasmic substrate-binding protein [Natronorubrum sulfidifaciens JCM 14089]